jgi:hypothetical protein
MDQSEHHFDQLSSLFMISSLMYFVQLNYVQAKGQNAWGNKDAHDTVSLLTLCNKLPNHSDTVNLWKIDYYAWL